MATVKENKETITRSRLVGLKDICVAAVTTNDEDVYAADVPVRLAKAIAATVKDTFIFLFFRGFHFGIFYLNPFSESAAFHIHENAAASFDASLRSSGDSALN